jgi:hypothetical protein
LYNTGCLVFAAVATGAVGVEKQIMGGRRKLKKRTLKNRQHRQRNARTRNKRHS